MTCVAQLREVLVQRQRAGLALIGRVDVDDVDVGREVELLAAELAHADHGERARRARRRRRRCSAARRSARAARAS